MTEPPRTVAYHRISRDRPDDAETVAYLRISDDREGAGLGVQRQTDDCNALAARLGLPEPTPFTDNDLSAYSRRGKPRKRPQYDEMLEYLRTHRGCTILTWHTDRLHRTPRELEDFIDVVELGGHTVETVTGGPIDLATPMGRMFARQLCSIARYEVEHRGERIKRKHLEIAQSGRPSGGGPRSYGYEKDGVTIREAEAEALRYAYEQVIAGVSNRQLARDLAERGYATTEGKPWDATRIGRTLRRVRYAGLREHQGQFYPAVWDGIVDRETWERAQVALSGAPGRSWAAPVTSRAPRHLLTGFAVCGRDGCGKLLVMRPNNSRQAMACTSGPPMYGCGKISVNVAALTEMVSLYTVRRLSDARILRELVARETAAQGDAAAVVALIEADEKRLGTLNAAMDDADDLPEVISAARRIRGRLTESRRRLAAMALTPALADVNPATIAEDWKSMTERGEIDRQRALVRAVVDRVVVSPAVLRGSPKFDPRRVDIVPRRP